MTTIKLADETKKRILALDLAEKGKSFDVIINELITGYNKTSEKYKKDYKKWEEDYKKWEEEIKKYEKGKITWDKLLKWAKSKGFKE